MTEDYSADVNEHYGRSGLLDRIEAALRSVGKDPIRLTQADLGPIDQFHGGGLPTTRSLARLAVLQPGTTVLDVGGGFGGPARTLAAEFGCRVTVVDLTEEYCRVGEQLTARVGLADSVSFHHGNALELPFPEASFDVVWTQNSTMNIQDRVRLYRGFWRVLMPGGAYALQEVMAGLAGPVHYPTPWARDPALSFLYPPEQVRAWLTEAGFQATAWSDLTQTTRSASAQSIAPAAGALPAAVDLVHGTDAAEMQRRNLANQDEGRVVSVQALLRKP